MNNLHLLSGRVIHDKVFKTNDEQYFHKGSCKSINGKNKIITLMMNEIRCLKKLFYFCRTLLEKGRAIMFTI